MKTKPSSSPSRLQKTPPGLHRVRLRLGLAACVLFLLGLLLIPRWVFLAQEVLCFTQFGSCPDRYQAALSGFKNTPLLYPLPRQSIQSHLSGFPEIRQIKVYRRLPATLVVSLELRSPIGSVSSAQANALALVDSDGVVISHVQSTGLPTLFTASLPAPGQVLGASDVASLKSLAAINSLSRTRPTGFLSHSTLRVVGDENMEILIDVNQKVENWYPSLQAILARSRISARTPQKVDLRLFDPVVVYRK